MPACDPGTPSERQRLPGGIIGCVAVCLLTFSTPCLGAVICPDLDDPGVRVDLQTVLISPSAREGYVQADIFLGLRVSETAPPESPFSILIPVEGVPLSVKAQAMTLSEFDRRYTHAASMEGAFYARACAEHAGQTCLYTSIAATSGPPAWFLIAPHWPPKGPPITAVIPEPRGDARPYHSVRDAQIVVLDGISSLPPSHSSDHLITVSFTPLRTPERERQQCAATGIRISYEAPMMNGDDGWRLRLPLIETPSSSPVALTRVYVNMPATRNAEIDVPGGTLGSASSQRIVNDALGAFGYSDTFRARAAQQRANTSFTSVRTSHGGKTLRVVASFAHSDMALSLRVRRSAAGPARAAMTALGAVLLSLLWPVAVILYVAAIWGSARAYYWMLRLRPPENSVRSMAMLAGLFPIITPWLALRFAAPKGALPDDGDRSGALGTLSMRHYDALARLVLWGALIGVNWAILESILRLALYLRFQ